MPLSVDRFHTTHTGSLPRPDDLIEMMYAKEEGKAIATASLALHGDGTHRVSLDSVIATMRQTGADMQSKYKETSLGGLAVNFVEC